jgi:hypothetical protein
MSRYLLQPSLNMSSLAKSGKNRSNEAKNKKKQHQSGNRRSTSRVSED